MLRSALVIGYNLPGIKNLILTGEQLVAIYNGTLRSWSDPTFSVYNPEVVFPNATIVPIARLDMAGTTEIFTNSLSSFSAEWNNTFGVFTDPARWNPSVVTVFGQRVTGMVDTILDRRHSVGYISPASANEVGLDYARMVNRHGNVVDATTASVQSAMNSGSLNERLTGIFVDSDHPDAYPMAGYVYFIIHKSVMVNYCQSSVELVRYIMWFLNNREAFNEAESRNMASISSPIAAKIQSVVFDQIKCDGQRIVDLVRKQQYDEEESLKTWKTPVEVITPIVALVVIALIVNSVLQKIKYRRALDRNDWKINFCDIDFSIPKRRSRNQKETETKSIPDHSELGHGQSTHKTDAALSISGRLSGNSVAATEMRLEKIFELDRSVREALLCMRDSMIHENVTRFFGLSWSNSNRLYMIREDCERGTLKNVLWSENYQTNEAMKVAVSKEIANGMTFLHNHRIVHGTLSLSSCLVDSRWSVKVTDWEYAYLYEVLRKTKGNRKKLNVSSALYHMSQYFRESYRKEERPEDLRTFDLKTYRFSFEPTRAGDVHNFGIIMYEIFTLTQARYGCLTDPTTPVEEADRIVEEMRNNIRLNETINAKARQIIDSALQKNSIMRPTFQQILLTLSATTHYGKSSFLDIMMEELEAYAAKASNQLQKVTCDLAEAECRSNKLTDRAIPMELLGISDIRLIEEPVMAVHQSVAVLDFRIRSFRKQDASIESTLAAITQFSWQLHEMATRIVDSQEHLNLVEETSESLVILTPPDAFPDSPRPIAAAVGCLVSFARSLHDQASELASAFPSAVGLSLTAAIHCGPVSSILARSGPNRLPRCFFFGEAVETVRQLASDETRSDFPVLSEKAKLELDGFAVMP